MGSPPLQTDGLPSISRLVGPILSFQLLHHPGIQWLAQHPIQGLRRLTPGLPIILHPVSHPHHSAFTHRSEMARLLYVPLHGQWLNCLICTDTLLGYQ